LIVRGLANLCAAGVLVYLTYFFTMFFAHKPPPPAPVPEEMRVAAKKIEELKAEERKLLSTYGEVDPVTKTLRIPVDRAMELVVAESAKPVPPPAFTLAPAAVPATAKPGPATATPKPETVAAKPATAAPKPETVAAKSAAPAPAAPAAPAPAPAATPAPTPAPAAVAALPPPGAARGGFTQNQLFGFVCKSCHDGDGKGGIGRKSLEPGMALIPDFTDPKWQLSRTNADLIHSMLEGKGQGMKPVKDKLELAKLQPEEMAAFIRSFSPSTVAATSGAPAPVAETKPAAPAVASAPKPANPTPATSVSAPASKPATPEAVKPVMAASTRPTPSQPAGTKPAASAIAAASTPKPTTPEAIKPAPGPAHEPEALTPEQMKLLAALAGPAPGGAGAAAPRPDQPTVPPETLSFFMMNCMACHGLDGRGLPIVRAAMPPLPDFTSKDFQLGHSNPQLKVSILNGKGTFMPPWRDKLSPELAASLATYVRGFGPPGLFPSQTASSSEFAKSFDSLQKEWDALELQMKSLSRR